MASLFSLHLLGRKPPPPVAHAEADSIDALSLGLLSLAALCCLLSYSALPNKLLRSSACCLLAFVLNVATVSLPGRFDSNAEDMSMPWPTIFSPAGFTFAIWGVIYLGEASGVLMLVLGWSDARQAASAANPGWLAANCTQALWCLAFRPWALSRLWLPTTFLAMTAGSLFVGQRALYATSAGSAVPRAILGVPRSLHLGWVSAATLVNLNAFVGYSNTGPAAALATAILSIVAGVLLGLVFIKQNLPAASAAVGWALFGLSRGSPTGRDAEALGSDVLSGLSQAYIGSAVLVLSAILLAIAVVSKGTGASKEAKVRVGVGVIAIRPDGRLIMGERIGSHGANKMAFPGGHLEMGESWEQTALRELVEETGLQASSAEHVATTNDYMAAEGKHYITLFMVVRLLADAEPINREPSKCAGWHWVTWHEIEMLSKSRLFVPVINLIHSGFQPPTRVGD